MVNQESDKDSGPEEHRDEGSLFQSQEGISIPRDERYLGVPIHRYRREAA